MIQVDVFWSFAMGACFAALSAKILRVEGSIVVNSYFVYTICFMGIIFGPSGVYLLWEFPGWESMFVLNRDMITGSLIAAFSSTNVLFGAIGFLVAGYFVRNNQPLMAHTIWVLGYVIMFGILGFGYKRFTYSGDAAEWAAGIEYPITRFFESKVFYTLLSMGLFIIPGLYYPIITWPKSCGSSKTENKAAFRRILLTAFVGICIGALGYVIWLKFLADSSQIVYVTMNDFDFTWDKKRIVFGPYSPLVGYFVAEISFFCMVIFPFLLQTSARKKYKKK